MVPKQPKVSAATVKVVAFFDLGTNSVRLSVARISGHSYTTMLQQKETIRLGQGEFGQQQMLQPEAMNRAVKACKQLVALAKAHGAQQIIAIATSACREAGNREEFLQRLQREAGLEVHVVPGKEEARLIYLGVSSGLNLGKRQALFIDVGGGSTEVIVGSAHGYRYLDSLKLGAIRVSNIFFGPADSGKVSPRRYREIQEFVGNVAVRVLQKLRGFEFDLAVGSSGTIMNLAQVAAHNVRGRGSRRADVLSLTDLQETVRLLCRLNLEDRRRVPGLNPARADIIIGGAAIVQTLMEQLSLKEIRISERSMREGLPVDYLSRKHAPPALRGLSFRERSVLQLGRACNFDEKHSFHVARLALQLFDSAATAGLHDLGAWERELLEDAALLHDVGAFLSYNNHRRHSYYLIRNAELLGFDQRELDIIATVALFHRRTLPSEESPEMAVLDSEARAVVWPLCMFLRMAESLDRSHKSPVRAATLSGGKKLATLSLEAGGDCSLELAGVHEHGKAFKRVFVREMRIHVEKIARRGKPSP